MGNEEMNEIISQENISAAEENDDLMPNIDIDKAIKNTMQNLFGINEDGTIYDPVDIGRNDSCPCGSGRKYKKCCSRIDPDKSREEYIADLSSLGFDSLNLIGDAIEDHPVDPLFNFIYGYKRLDKGNFVKAGEYFYRTWRIAPESLDVEFIKMMLMVMIEGEQLSGAETVARSARKGFPEDDTLLALEMVIKLKLFDLEEALSLLEEARNRRVSPNEVPMLAESLEKLLKYGFEKEVYQYWLDNFDVFDPFQSESFPEFLLQKLEEIFEFSGSEAGKTVIKEKLQSLLIFLNIVEEFEEAKSKENQEKALQCIDEMAQILPDNGRNNMLLIEMLYEIMAWQKLIDFAEQKQIEKEDFPLYNFYLADALMNTGKIEEAFSKIEQAEQLMGYRTIENDLYRKIAGKYLEIVIMQNKDKKLINFIEDLEKKLVPERDLMSLLGLIMKNYDQYLYVQILEKLSYHNPEFIEKKELSVALEHGYLHAYQIYHEQEKVTGELLKQVENKTEKIFKKRKQNKSKDESNSLVELTAETFLKIYKEDLSASEEEITENLEEILHSKVSFPAEAVSKYQILLQHGSREQIHQLLLDREDDRLIDKEYRNLFRGIAAIKIEETEILKDILQRTGSINKFIERLTGMAHFYISREEINKMRDILGALNKG